MPAGREGLVEYVRVTVQPWIDEDGVAPGEIVLATRGCERGREGEEESSIPIQFADVQCHVGVREDMLSNCLRPSVGGRGVQNFGG